MKLTIVGCSGSYPGPDSAASCYLLEEPYQGRTFRIVLDMGNGALGALQRYGDINDIDAILITHLHGDHCLDLCSYYVARRYHPDGPLAPVPVYGPEGAAERMACAGDLPVDPGMNQEFDFHAWDLSSPEKIGPFEVWVASMVHPVTTYGIRVENEHRSLVYSGDSAPTRALVELARDADVLLCESSFVEGEDNPPNLHMTGREAAEHAKSANVGRLLLTHIPPWHERSQVLADAVAAWDGPIELVSAGECYEI